jgi:hypothetical protein
MYLAEPSTATTPDLANHETAPAVVDCARALRAIGQDLTELFPKILQIDTDGVNFEARGQSHPNPFHQARQNSFKRLWSKLFGKGVAAGPVESAGLSFTRAYSPLDIDRLDQLYGANRSGQAKRPDNYSLAERLRTMGGIVKSRKGRFKQLRKDADHFFVDYWDQDGKVQTASLTTVILYRNQPQSLSRIGTPAPQELWEGYDF